LKDVRKADNKKGLNVTFDFGNRRILRLTSKDENIIKWRINHGIYLVSLKTIKLK